MKIFNHKDTCKIITKDETLKKVFYHNAFTLAEYAENTIEFYPSGCVTDAIWYNFFNDLEIDFEIKEVVKTMAHA